MSGGDVVVTVSPCSTHVNAPVHDVEAGIRSRPEERTDWGGRGDSRLGALPNASASTGRNHTAAGGQNWRGALGRSKAEVGLPNAVVVDQVVAGTLHRDRPVLEDVAAIGDPKRLLGFL